MSAFNNMANSIRDRNWGGTTSEIACEPYVSGYSYIAWSLPDAIAKSVGYINSGHTLTNGQTGIAKTDSEFSTGSGDSETKTTYPNINGICDTLEHAMNSVTPPGGTLNKVEIQGIGGTKWSVPGSIDYGNSISIKYLEMSGLPIHKIHRGWFNLIRDNHSGNTALTGGTIGNQLNVGIYNKSNYSGSLLYWTTKPDGVTVEFAAAYSGVFPTKDPMDLFNGDITSIDKLEIEIEYNVDMIYNEHWVYDVAQNFAKTYIAKNGTTRHLADGFRRSQGIGTDDSSKYNNRYTMNQRM